MIIVAIEGNIMIALRYITL